MSKRRHIYLEMKTLKEAKKILFNRFPLSNVLAAEKISVQDAVGRVLSESVTAALSSPGFHASAMDGIAVKAESTFGASETRPKKLVIERDAFHVNTGHVMPEGTDAVIMIEHVNALDENHVEI